MLKDRVRTRRLNEVEWNHQHCHTDNLSNGKSAHEVAGWEFGRELPKVEQGHDPGELHPSEVKIRREPKHGRVVDSLLVEICS
jgi:hypothetical protein